MKSGLSWFVVALVLIGGLTLATSYLTLEGTAYLVFGWLLFLLRVLPRVQVDGPSAAVGGVALVLFLVGLHAVVRSLVRPNGVAWKWRWSLACGALVVLAFTAGVAVIGVVHQVGWLTTAPEPVLVRTATSHSGSSTTNLRLMVIAMSNAQDSSGALHGGTFATDGTMLHSWETEILPFVPYAIECDRTKPWNDPVNQEMFKKTAPVLLNPDLRGAPYKDADGYGLSHYATNSRVLGGNRGVSLKDLDGHTSTTLLIGEVNANFKPWGHPVNWRDPVRGINRSPDGFGGVPGVGGANFALADGSVHFLNERISPDVLRALASPKAEDKMDSAALDGALGNAVR